MHLLQGLFPGGDAFGPTVVGPTANAKNLGKTSTLHKLGGNIQVKLQIWAKLTAFNFIHKWKRLAWYTSARPVQITHKNKGFVIFCRLINNFYGLTLLISYHSTHKAHIYLQAC